MMGSNIARAIKFRLQIHRVGRGVRNDQRFSIKSVQRDFGVGSFPSAFRRDTPANLQVRRRPMNDKPTVPQRIKDTATRPYLRR